MSTFYVDFASGSDTSGSGLESSPFRSIQRAVLAITAGTTYDDNTIYINGLCRPSLDSVTAYNNWLDPSTATGRPTSVLTWTTTSGLANPGFTLKLKPSGSCRITGRTPLSTIPSPPTWTETAAGIWSATLPIGLKVAALTYKYEDVNTWIPLVDGRRVPTGFFTMGSSLANVSSNPYFAYYNSVDGTTRINIPGLPSTTTSDQLNAALEVVFGSQTSAHADNLQAGMEFANSGANTCNLLIDLAGVIIDCINPMAAAASSGVYLPYGFALANGSGCIIKNSLVMNCGYHPFGIVGKINTNNTFLNCESLGSGPASTNFVHYSGNTGSTDTTGARTTGCYAGVYPPIRLDGLAFAVNQVVTSSPTGITGYLTHGDITNALPADYLVSRSVAVACQLPGLNISENCKAVTVSECRPANKPAVGSVDELDWDSYACRLDQFVSYGLPIVVGHSSGNVSCLAIRRSIIWEGLRTNTNTNTLNVPINGWLGSSTGLSTILLDAVWHKADYNFKDNGTTDRPILLWGATTVDSSKRLIVQNSSIVSSTDAARSLSFFYNHFTLSAATQNTTLLINNIVSKTTANTVNMIECNAAEDANDLAILLPRISGNVFYLSGGTVKYCVATVADTAAEFRTIWGSSNVLDVDPGFTAPNISPHISPSAFASSLRTRPLRSLFALNGPHEGHPGCWNPNVTIPCKSGTTPTFEDIATFLTGRKF